MFVGNSSIPFCFFSPPEKRNNRKMCSYLPMCSCLPLWSTHRRNYVGFTGGKKNYTPLVELSKTFAENFMQFQKVGNFNYPTPCSLPLLSLFFYWGFSAPSTSSAPLLCHLPLLSFLALFFLLPRASSTLSPQMRRGIRPLPCFLTSPLKILREPF